MEINGNENNHIWLKILALSNLHLEGNAQSAVWTNLVELKRL